MCDIAEPGATVERPKPPPVPTPALDRVAAALHAHRLRRSGGRVGDWARLDGASRHALRNEVLAVLGALTVRTLRTIQRERSRLWPNQSPSTSPSPNRTPPSSPP